MADCIGKERHPEIYDLYAHDCSHGSQKQKPYKCLLHESRLHAFEWQNDGDNAVYGRQVRHQEPLCHFFHRIRYSLP